MPLRALSVLFGILLAAASAYLLLPPNGEDRTTPPIAALPHPTYSAEPLLPLPAPPAVPADRAELGRRLFHDPRLSRDDSIACADCHDLNRGGADRRRFSVGINGAIGPINAPTVFNAGYNIAQFWDGRAATLEEQASGPIHNPAEMGSDWDDVLAKLRADTGYREAFLHAYGGEPTAADVVDAIATFERTLVTPNAPFDRFLRGDANALTEDEHEGYRRFREYGCVSCHQGVNIGGNMFQLFGVMSGYFDDRELSAADRGRFNVTGREEDRHVFKVPGLRNVAATPPYFHDGSAQTLEEAVSIMGRYQLGRAIADEDVRLIAAFLRSLSGEWNGQPVR